MLRIEEEKGRYAELADAPFDCERELEDYLASDPAAIGIDRIVARQLRTGAGVIDLLGEDRDGLVVVEVKAQCANRGAVAQAACYASWFATASEEEIARLLPDGSPTFPPRVRLAIVAAGVAPDAVRVAKALKFPVSFYTVRRWLGRGGADREEGAPYIVEAVPFPACEDGPRPPRKSRAKKGPKRASPLVEWTREKYLSVYASEAVEEFLASAEEIREFAAARGWYLEQSFRSEYALFKRPVRRGGRRCVFGVRFAGRRTAVYFFRLPFETAEKLAPARMRNYYEHRREAWFDITDDFEVDDFASLFDAAYAAAGA